MRNNADATSFRFIIVIVYMQSFWVYLKLVIFKHVINRVSRLSTNLFVSLTQSQHNISCFHKRIQFNLFISIRSEIYRQWIVEWYAMKNIPSIIWAAKLYYIRINCSYILSRKTKRRAYLKISNISELRYKCIVTLGQSNQDKFEAPWEYPYTERILLYCNNHYAILVVR